MNFHHWSSLYRDYDPALRHNRLLLLLTAVGAIIGFFLGGEDIAARALQGLVGGGVVFGAGALAKELAPDRAAAAVVAAIFALPFAAIVPPAGLVALFWLLGGMRLLNRTTGLPPRATDTLALVLVAVFLVWRISPLFGLLAGIMLALDALLPDGRGVYLALGLLALGTAGWLAVEDGQGAEGLPLAYTVLILVVATAFIPIILNSFQMTAVGDVTSEPLHPLRIQAAQAFALSVGLFSASWLGQSGILLLAGLWAGLAGVLAHHLITSRSRHPSPSL